MAGGRRLPMQFCTALWTSGPIKCVRLRLVPFVPRRFLWLGLFFTIVLFMYILLPKASHYGATSPTEKNSFLPDYGHLEESDGNHESNLVEDSCERKKPIKNALRTEVEVLETWDTLYNTNNHSVSWLWSAAFTSYGSAMDYSPNQFSVQPKLKVIVVPFSHIDPGWLKTYDEYGLETNQILDNVVAYLKQHPKMTFMWTEISFLYKCFRLVDEKRVDFTTGSWVMTDEASPYFWETIDNMVEGHQYIYNEMGAFPSASWTNDPFGYGTSVAYLFRLSNVKNLVINRIHRVLKGHLGQMKALDFTWKQSFDHSGAGDIFTTVSRGAHYDILNTCGPDASVCCQFDFKRLTHYHCGGTTRIDNNNVADKAETLHHQYRKYAQLSRTNVFLQILGDDFRYEMIEEFNQQHDNYQVLFEYMNKQKDWNVEVKFGTYADYFKELASRTKEQSLVFPTFSGDFFPYNDYYNDVWTGYFTSRPFYKRLERATQSHLRAADLISAFAIAKSVGANKGSGTGSGLSLAMSQLLSEARKDLAIFQHHDAITGTSKPHVVIDYGKKLFKSLNAAASVIRGSIQFLLNDEMPTASATYQEQLRPIKTDEPYSWNLESKLYKMVSIPSDSASIALSTPLLSNNEKSVKVVVFNQLPYFRRELVKLVVKKTSVQVRDSHGLVVLSQLNPHIFPNGTISADSYELVFMTDMPPLAVVQFLVKVDNQALTTVMAHVLVTEGATAFEDIPKRFEAKPLSGNFTLQSPYWTSFHGHDGLVKAVERNKTGINRKLEMNFWYYRDTSSGPYLFKPNGNAKRVPDRFKMVIVVNGPIESTSWTFFPDFSHSFTLLNVNDAQSSAIRVRNFVDLRQRKGSGTEIVMRIQTDVDNQNIFYTDSNGLQNLVRKHRPERRIEENYYPIAASVLLEDRSQRVTVFAGQPHGVASLLPGMVEVMLDRISNTDDGKGLGSAAIMNDNVPVESYFRILLEDVHSEAAQETTPQVPPKLAYHSLLGHHVFQDLLYAGIVLHSTGSLSTKEKVSDFVPLDYALPCSAQLLNIRPLTNSSRSNKNKDVAPSSDYLQRLLLLHRTEFECKFDTQIPYSCRRGSSKALVELLKLLRTHSAHETSLTGIFTKSEALEDFSRLTDTLKPMDVKAYKLSLLAPQ